MPRDQLSHLFHVGCLFSTGDQPNDVSKLDDGGVALGGDVVVVGEGVKEWTEHTALGGSLCSLS